MRIKVQHRKVSNEEIQICLKDQKIKGMMRTESAKYKNQLDKDQRDSAVLVALWRTLQYHKEELSKFTTNLYRFIHFELRRELKKQSKYSNDISLDDIDEPTVQDSNQDPLECIQNKEANEAIFGYFIENKTLKEISKDKNWSMNRLKDNLKLGISNLKENL